MLYTFTSYATVYELYVALLRGFIVLAVGLSVLVSLDRLWHVLKCAAVTYRAKWTGQRPEDAFRHRALPNADVDGQLYPKVAVQLPMFNERAVCQAIIDSACELHWPPSRLRVQVMHTSFLLPWTRFFDRVIFTNHPLLCLVCSASASKENACAA